MILLLALVLLLPGVGWAQEQIGKEADACYWWFDKDDGLQMEGPGCKRFLLERANTFSPVLKNNCTYEAGSGNIIVYDCERPPEHICLDQMREAMRYMDDFVQQEKGYYHDNEIYPSKDHWNQTMKECVEDKP